MASRCSCCCYSWVLVIVQLLAAVGQRSPRVRRGVIDAEQGIDFISQENKVRLLSKAEKIKMADPCSLNMVWHSLSWPGHRASCRPSSCKLLPQCLRTRTLAVLGSAQLEITFACIITTFAQLVNTGQRQGHSPCLCSRNFVFLSSPLSHCSFNLCSSSSKERLMASQLTWKLPS